MKKITGMKTSEDETTTLLMLVVIVVSAGALLNIPAIACAYFAGISLANTQINRRVQNNIDFMASGIFVPIVFIIIGFSAIMLFVYSVFTLIDDLWPSVIKMGACLMASGITVIAIAALFKGIKVFFKLLKSGFQKIKNMLLLKKLEGQKDEQNT